jgi:hypothetical protein
MKDSCISLLTDFGLCDEYVGVMKGVISSINPNANIIDMCHNISPQNIVQAAYMLCFSHSYFPKKTIHVVVVDPGVGTDRRIVALQIKNFFFLAPDNGVLTLIINKYKCKSVYLTQSQFYLSKVSSTFHGRDIFAPVAAYLSKDYNIHQLGETISTHELKRISDIYPVKYKDRLKGQVIMIDHFGNLITNISYTDIHHDTNRTVTINIINVSIENISSNYTQVKKGALLAIIGSKGLLEISINCGNAKLELGVDIGCIVQVVQTKI